MQGCLEGATVVRSFCFPRMGVILNRGRLGKNSQAFGSRFQALPSNAGAKLPTWEQTGRHLVTCADFADGTTMPPLALGVQPLCATCTNTQKNITASQRTIGMQPKRQHKLRSDSAQQMHRQFEKISNPISEKLGPSAKL